MVMAQGFTQDQVKSILDDINGSSLINDKTKKLLGLARITTQTSHKVHGGTIQELRNFGCSDEEIFETISVVALFSFMDRMADALGAPVEGMQEMISQMQNQ